MPTYNKTFIEEQNKVKFEKSENIFVSPEVDDTDNILVESNYYSVSNKKDNISIQINVSLESNKAANKKYNG